MGLPVGKLVCASNENNVLTDFLTTGTYTAKREFFKTTSPSMDILVSSNLERLLYHVTGSDAEAAGLMKSLAGVIGVGAAFFGASWCANRFVTPVSQWLEPLLRESIRQKLSGQDGADAGELLSAFAFDTHSLEKILEDVAQRVKETGESVFSAVTESVSHSIAYGIVYAAAFIAILLVVWLLLKPLDLAGKLPVVRTVNAWGGALLGLVWAVLLLFAAVWLMQRFNWVVTPELIRDSILLKFFAENNPIGLIAAL